MTSSKNEDMPIEACRERLRFEELITALSARFVQVPSERLETEIDQTLRQLCEHLDLDISTFWACDPVDPEVLVLKHVYRRVDDPPIPERMLGTEYFPWCNSELMAGRTIVLDDVEAVPTTETDREGWRNFRIRSNLAFPLSAGGGKVLGILSFCTTGRVNHWTEPQVKRLGLVAGVFANAIVRKRADEDLRRSEARLQLAADASDAGLWGLDPGTGLYWLTDKARSAFGFDLEEEVTLTRVLEVVVDEDRDRVREAVDEVVASGRDGQVEYRIDREGDVRWMKSRGRVTVDPDGRHSLTGVTIDITEAKHAELSLENALEEVRRLKDRMQRENVYLRDQIRTETGHLAIIGESEPVLAMLTLAEQVAPTDATVLITGETGTGKELLAQAIHDLSPRKSKLLVKVNCAALPAALIESELFGREKGAYTGAMTRQTGRFEIADGSTIFLDEIGELSLEHQVKLLRVLEYGQFERLGSHQTLKTNVRVVAATNRDLRAMVEEGTFREDFFHRLNVFPIEVPSLRLRPEDIPLLVWKFVEEFNKKMGRSIDSIPRDIMRGLQQYSWPGNVRELRNLIERAMILSNGRVLNLHPPALTKTEHLPSDLATLEDIERHHMLGVLKRTEWRISGRGGAAEILGLVPTTLHSRMKKLGIVRPGR